MAAIFPEALLAPGALRTRFQLIFHIGSGEPIPFAAECLTRGPRHTRFERADLLFHEARRAQREADVDHASISAALESAQHCTMVERLFLNVHPATLRRDRAFAAFLVATAVRCRIAPAQLTLELLEHARHELDACQRDTLAALRRIGVRLAVDDFRASSPDRRLLHECRPDYVKLDRRLLWEARQSPARRRRLARLLEATAGTSILIAEGVETESDLDVVRELGIRYIQGFLVGRPVQAASLRQERRIS